ncbi:MAG TPA: L,D-transpeptidase family protein, partial [Gammaproteobacteria bacterium]|nr:L,D-transpeptidase family protein [Gammaproteobacteria bacterium]
MIRFTIAALLITSLTACQYLADLRSREADELSQPSEVLPPAVRAQIFPLREDSDLVGQVQIVTTRYEDTLFDLARKFGLGIRELAQANPGVNKWVPGEGSRVILPTQFILPDAPRKGIVLNLAAMRLFYYPKHKPGETPVVITHPVGIGRENWSTPIGLTKVVKKIANPSWIVPASIRKEHAAIGDPLPAMVPPGPDNP